jgi:hypothetical protein
MDYAQKYRELANQVWQPLHKGSLFDDEGEIRKFTGLSGGEGVVYEVCKAIAEPGDHSMPRLDDICHRLSDVHQKRILAALTEMFFFRC